jgi:thiamine kinase-like enzyme
MYGALCHLRQLDAQVREEKPKAKEYVKWYRKLGKVAMRMKELDDLGEAAPFVPLHNDLSLSNILVRSNQGGVA